MYTVYTAVCSIYPRSIDIQKNLSMLSAFKVKYLFKKIDFAPYQAGLFLFLQDSIHNLCTRSIPKKSLSFNIFFAFNNYT